MYTAETAPLLPEPLTTPVLVVALPLVVDLESSCKPAVLGQECASLLRAARNTAAEYLFHRSNIPRLSFNVFRHPFDEANHREDASTRPKSVSKLAGTARRGPSDDAKNYLNAFVEDYFVLLPPTSAFFPLHFFNFVNSPRQVAEARAMGIPRMWGPASTTGTTEGDDDDLDGHEADATTCFADSNRITIFDRRTFELHRTARHTVCSPKLLSQWKENLAKELTSDENLLQHVPNEVYLMIVKENPSKQHDWTRIVSQVQTPYDCVMRLRYRVTAARDDHGLPLSYSLRRSRSSHPKQESPLHRGFKAMFASPFAFAVDQLDESAMTDLLGM